ncbi:MAG: DinB family protein [Fimbriimonas sp.]
MISTYLHKGLELGPAAILRLARAVPPADYDRKTDPERFSFREAIAHIADWGTIDMQRLQAGLAEPGCTVQGIDEGQRAIDENYAAKDPIAEAERLVASRRELIALIDGLSDEQLAIVFNHSERGPLTVTGHLVTMLGHETYHIEHLTQYL